jgi:hypothetical protein
MHQVTGSFIDYGKPSLKSNFYLDADKDFNPYTWAAPIKWSGIVGGVEVSFKQISPSAYDKSCFDWTDFPDEVSGAIYDIVEAIDKAMKVMD